MAIDMANVAFKQRAALGSAKIAAATARDEIRAQLFPADDDG